MTSQKIGYSIKNAPTKTTLKKCCFLIFVLSFSQLIFADYQLANPTEEPDPNTVTVITTGIIDGVDDPHNYLTSKIVSIGSTFTTSVAFKPTDDNFHFSMYAPMPGSWQVSFGNVEAKTSGTTIQTHWDESFDDIIWIQNTGIGNTSHKTPVKAFSEVSGLPALVTLTGVSLAFAYTGEPTPDTIADAINEAYLNTFNFQEFYARISHPWALDDTLASVHGTIVEIVVLQGNTQYLKLTLNNPEHQPAFATRTLKYKNP